MTRAAIYTRVSSEEQLEGYSLEAQLEACRALCEYRHWDVAFVFEERGRSGKTVIRPEFQAMIAAAESKAFDVIVVHKLDRFSRSLLDVLQYLNRLHIHDVSFVSATEDFDFSTPFGKLILAVLGAFAQWYIDNLSAETRKGKRQRAKSGGWNGTLSFGYTTPRQLRKDLAALGDRYRAGDVGEGDYSAECERIETALDQYAYRYDSAAVPHYHNRDGVLLAYETYATGLYSDTDVAWRLNEAGYRTSGNWGENLFSKDTVTWLLQNRFYIGETSYQGKRKGDRRKWLPGDHEPLISRELFERCQQVRKLRNAASVQNTSPKRNTKVYPLSPLLVCLECGSNWRGQYIRGVRRYRDPARDLGLICHQSPKSVKADDLEEQMDYILRDLLITLPADLQRLAFDKVKEQAAAVAPGGVDTAKLRARLDRAKKLFVMGDLSEGDYQALREEITAMLPAPTASTAQQLDFEYVAELLSDFGRIWDVALPEERKVLLQHLFVKIYVSEGLIVAIEPTPTLWHIQNYAKMENTVTVATSDENDGDTSDGSDGPRMRRGYLWLLPGTARRVVSRLVAA